MTVLKGESHVLRIIANRPQSIVDSPFVEAPNLESKY